MFSGTVWSWTVTATTSPRKGKQAHAFVDEGFVVLPGLLTGESLRRAKAAADGAVTSPAGISCERPNNTLVPLRWDDELVNIVLAGHTRIAQAISAKDLRWISGYVSVKEPHSPPLWWHQDWWAWDHGVTFKREAPQVALLCYLSDTTQSTGALRVLPGSHSASTPLHRILPEAHSDESTGLDLHHPAMVDQPNQVTLELRAGDAVITDYRLLHGTHAHAADHRRDCVILNFAPDWNTLPTDIRGHLISHSALPRHDEPVTSTTVTSLLPSFDGPRRDLPLNRNAPATFETKP